MNYTVIRYFSVHGYDAMR